jgi:hypothetical protein
MLYFFGKKNIWVHLNTQNECRVMQKRFVISPQVYEQVLDQLNKQFLLDRAGYIPDLHFIQTDFWLQDTAVIDTIEQKSGLWRVSLLFVHHINPFKFIKRSITAYADIKKANTAAHYMRRQAAKDQRGTLLVNTTLFAGTEN